MRTKTKTNNNHPKESPQNPKEINKKDSKQKN